MSYYKLLRKHSEGEAVVGKLYEVHHYFNKRSGQHVERLCFVCDTLENAAFLIPALVYRVQVTKSPKFQRLLPELVQVPGRTGIRVHRGTKPEHSRGCILVSASDEQALTSRFLAEQSAREETRLEICNPRPASCSLNTL